MAQNLKLPACERCRLRKIKCDGQAPKCSSCDKAQVACILVDAVSHERYTRQAVSELEDKLKGLEARRKAIPEPVVTNTHGEHHFIGPGSGLGFLKYLFSTADWVNTQADLLQHLNVRQPMPDECSTPLGLPPYQDAKTLVECYFRHSYVQHPCPDEATILKSLQRLYNYSEESPTAQDRFRIFMVLAISAVKMYRCKQIQTHPYGYYNAALQYMAQAPLLGSTDGIQNTLLLMRFATFYHIKMSVWGLSQLCMRQCIELGLHRKTNRQLKPLEEQNNRRIFWACYVRDRHSSGTLGRPYAISDREIDQDLPVNVEDQDIQTSKAGTLDKIGLESGSGLTRMSNFLWVIGLRRITSRVQKAFFSPPRRAYSRHVFQISDAGQAYSEARKLLAELCAWRVEAPVYDNPRCLYERPEWQDWLVAKDKLFLLRGAMGRMSLSGLHPARDLLHSCLDSATRVIELYIKMYHSDMNTWITWTRSYFQILFTAGLSIMFSLSILKLNHDKGQMRAASAGIAALEACSKILRIFVEHMPDATRFALVFEALRKKCVSEQGPSCDASKDAGRESENPGMYRQVGTFEDRLHHNKTADFVMEWHRSRQRREDVEIMYGQKPPRQRVDIGTTNPAQQPFDTSNPQNMIPQAATEERPHQEQHSDEFGWPILDDDLREQMEVGIGQYALGDPNAADPMWQEIFSWMPAWNPS